MPDLRESLAGTVLASLEWSEIAEKAIDRVAASGKAHALGLSLWKAKYQLEVSSYHDARGGLIRLFRAKYPSETPEIAVACVDEALHEWLGPACKACLGARELVSEALRVVCSRCNGSGLERYSDVQRAKRMQLSVGRVHKLARRLQWLAGELGSLDRAVNSVLCEELER